MVAQAGFVLYNPGQLNGVILAPGPAVAIHSRLHPANAMWQDLYRQQHLTWLSWGNKYGDAIPISRRLLPDVS